MGFYVQASQGGSSSSTHFRGCERIMHDVCKPVWALIICHVPVCPLPSILLFVTRSLTEPGVIQLGCLTSKPPGVSFLCLFCVGIIDPSCHTWLSSYVPVIRSQVLRLVQQELPGVGWQRRGLNWQLGTWLKNCLSDEEGACGLGQEDDDIRIPGGSSSERRFRQSGVA